MIPVDRHTLKRHVRFIDEMLRDTQRQIKDIEDEVAQRRTRVLELQRELELQEPNLVDGAGV